MALFIPTIHTQLIFNSLAGTDMVSHLEYLKALTSFHKNLREGFYPKIFNNKPANSINWKNYDAKFYTIKRDFNSFQLFMPSFIITLIIAGFGAINLRRL